MADIKKLLTKNKLAIITCYDASFAKLMEFIKVDAVLVGDSLGLMIKGENNTHKVTIEEVCYHTKSVRRGTDSLPIIADMPIGSFANKKLALFNSSKLIEAGADLIKIEGGLEVANTVEFLNKNGVAVCGHIGYMPQNTLNNKKKYNVKVIKKEAETLVKAGAKILVLSMLPTEINEAISKSIDIPLVTYRSESKGTGEVEILYDLLGISSKLIDSTSTDNAESYSKLSFSSLKDFVTKVHNKT
jgi:3-methyl-2-oxobutanoate hydroxymethyltransferase